ncbi:hypothetical protein KY285_032002 [Solanum tuberosum]|nr:hypothetical protein KY285_032002 [Solanum tuberosum]
MELGVENIETFGCRVNKKELLQARQSNIQEQVKEKTARVNLDEISSGPVGIDVGFKDIYKEKRGRFEGNLGGDDLYFDSSDPGNDISEDEGDPVKNDEVVDPAPRKESTKIYFDPTAKKKNVAAGTSVATSNVVAGTSVASAATVGSQSSVNTGPSAGCTPSVGPSACPSASCTPSAGPSADNGTRGKGDSERLYGSTLDFLYFGWLLVGTDKIKVPIVPA